MIKIKFNTSGLDEYNNDIIRYLEENNIDDNSLNECDLLKWLISALIMYSEMNLNDIKQEKIFIEYMTDKYKEFLNDYIHLISDHSHQLEIINK